MLSTLRYSAPTFQTSPPPLRETAVSTRRFRYTVPESRPLVFDQIYDKIRRWTQAPLRGLVIQDTPSGESLTPGGHRFRFATPAYYKEVERVLLLSPAAKRFMIWRETVTIYLKVWIARLLGHYSSR